MAVDFSKRVVKTGGNFASRAGAIDPNRMAAGASNPTTLPALQRAQAKIQAGLPLSREEALALSNAQASGKNIDKVAVALQPFMALSDVTKGIIGQVRGPQKSTKDLITQEGSQPQGGALQRGLKAAGGHLTYGLAEYLPGMTGARANGVTGMELLKGSKYEGDQMAALAVEVLADPSIVLSGVGLLAKGASTVGRIAQVEKLASTAEGAAKIRAAVLAANSKGDKLLRLGDEITGVPIAVRTAAKTKPVQAVKTAMAKAADMQLPNWVPGANAIRREGGGTLADAFATPDVKKAIFTPEQMARDTFRTESKLGIEELGTGIKNAVQADAKVVTGLTKGLKQSDAAEVNRLLGIMTTTSKPEIAAEALRKLGVVSGRVGRNLEPEFVKAVQASDRIGQVTLGRHLEAQDLPVVLNPAVTKQIQEAQSGADLVGAVGKYATKDGRPRGILMTQYTGRDNPVKVIQKLAEGPQLPAKATVDEAATARTLQGSVADLPTPAKPIEPVGVAPKGEPPLNAPAVAERYKPTPKPAEEVADVATADRATDIVPAPREAAPTADAVPPAPARTPQQVVEDLFTSSTKKSDVTFSPRTADNAAAASATAERATAEVADAAPAPAPRPAEDFTPPTRDTAPDIADVTPPPRTPAQVVDELVNPAPTAPTQGVNSVADMQNLRGMGQGISDSMYDMLHAKYVAGETAELGKPSTILMGAANLKAARGIDLSRPQFEDFAQQLKTVIDDSRGAPDFQDNLQTFFRDYEPPAAPTPAPAPRPAAATAPDPTPLPIPDAPAGNTAALLTDAAPVPKTPQQVISDILAPATDPLIVPSASITRTPQSVLDDLINPAAPAPEQLVLRNVDSTYRTVQADANALDWAALPDDAARRAVLNSIEDAKNARFVYDAGGALRLDRPNITVPLDHPTVSRYFSNDELMAAQRQGTDLGERTITRKEQVPNWFNPRDTAPLDVQRAMRDQALQDAHAASFPNDIATVQARQAANDDAAWLVGDAYASFERQAKPGNLNTRQAANDYAARVQQFAGRPPTKAELFQYRLQLARYRRAAALKNMDAKAVSQHLKNFYESNPEATLYEGVLNAAREFNLGREGAKHLQQVLRQSESGFMRELSTLERKEFAQMLLEKDATRRAGGGGSLTARLKRNPETVSEEFQQVFEQDINALRLIDEQVRSRTGAIVKAERFREYRNYLEQTGQLITQKQLAALRQIPEHRLTPEQLAIRQNAANAVTAGGAHAGWKVMDRNVEGYFQKGDVVPWWAHFDLFGAGHIEDAAVSSSMLGRGGLDVYNRLWSSMNAQMLGTPTSIVNDQIGQLLQMHMWGVTPDAVVEGMIRRATAKPAELEAMRASGIQSAKLESDIGADSKALSNLAARLDNETDMSRMERVVDAVLRFRERGTGLNPQAMTGAAGVAADVAHFGSGYLFQLRSAMSDLQRESLYFHRIALGDTPKAAAAYANEVMLDMRLVPAYARVVRKFWPFFNWVAMSGPRSIVSVLRKPTIASAYHRIAGATDNPDDPKDDTRRILARDGGYVNLGILKGTPLEALVNERNGTRVYLDPRNWDPTNTIPQLLDFSGTKVGSVGLPWYANLVVTLQWGQDRFGRNIYDGVLNGGNGGFTEAYKANPSKTLKIAATAIYQQFNPSYAPGSPRAQAFVRAVLSTAQLPDDGSKDIAIAKTLANTPQGRAYLVYMQNGNLAAIDRNLMGVRESKYSAAPPSLWRAAGNFLFPLRGIQADQNQQGDALQQLSVGQLSLQNWLAQQKKELEQLEAGGASLEQIHAKETEIDKEAERRGARLDMLDIITR